MSNLIGKSFPLEFQFINLWKLSWHKNFRRIVFLDFIFSRKLRYDNTVESWVIGTFIMPTFLNFHLVIQHDEQINDDDPRVTDEHKDGLL